MNDTAPKTDSTAVANIDPVAKLLETNRKSIEAALPKHVAIDRFLRISLTTIKRTPKLLEADRRSLIAALMTSAQLGLEPDGVLGHAYLVPFKVKGQTQVQFIVGYKGYIQLARNSGEIASIQAKVVHEGDEFAYEYGFNEALRHVPKNLEGAPLSHVWLVVNFKNGGRHWDVMDRRAIDRVKLMSQGYQRAEKEWDGKPAKRDSPWHLHYDAMALKTIIRANAKFLPLAVQKAVAIDDAVDLGGIGKIEGDQVIIEGTAEEVTGEPEATEQDKEQGGEQGGAESARPPQGGPEQKPATEAAAKENTPPASPPPPPPATIEEKSADPKKPVEQEKPTPEKKKGGRPARKAAEPPPPPEQPWHVVRKDDQAATYAERLTAALKAAKSKTELDAAIDAADWTWLAAADADVHDGCITVMEEREDDLRDSAAPAAEESAPAQEPEPSTQPASEYAPPVIGWGGKAQAFFEAIMAELPKLRTKADLDKLLNANKGNIPYLARFAPDLNTKFHDAQTARRKELP